MRTRPRRSHHRPFQRYLDTGSLPLRKHFPPSIAAALQSCPGRVWTRAGPRPSRGTTPRVGVIRHPLLTLGIVGYFFGGGFLVVFSLAGVSGCLRAVCCVCVLVRVCVCVFVVFLPWAFVALSVFLQCLCCCGGPFGSWLLVFVSSWSCSGRFSGPVSWWFPPGSRKTHWGSDESATRPFSVSEVLKADESSANVSFEGASHRTSELSSYEMAHAGCAAHCGIGQTYGHRLHHPRHGGSSQHSFAFPLPHAARSTPAAYAVRSYFYWIRCWDWIGTSTAVVRVWR